MKKICKTCGKEFESRNGKLNCSEECNIIYKAEKNRANTRRATKRLKDEFYEHYGNECVICGENDNSKLTVGHIHDNGREHRKNVGDSTYTVIKSIKDNNWPDNFVQTECFNCNHKKKMQKQTLFGTSYSTLLRKEVLTKFGNKCCVCGCEDVDVLELTTVDYKYKTKMTKIMLFNHLLKNEDDKYCVMCRSCNMSRRVSD